MHTGVADRRMRDPIWPAFTRERDVVRVDLRGSGDSAARPAGPVWPAGDVLGALAEIGGGLAPARGAGRVALAAPGGSLLAEVTPDLQAFFNVEGTALTL